MEATAKVIPWSSKPATAKEKIPAAAEMATGPVETTFHYGTLDDVILWIPDEQLEALGTLFAASPLRRAMTFEGYLVVKGYGLPAH